MPLNIQLTWPIIFAGCLGAFAAILANCISFVMIGKINERIPEGERISYFWWGTEVRKKFKHLYPRNRLVLLLDFSVIVMAVCFAIVVRYWVFG